MGLWMPALLAAEVHFESTAGTRATHHHHPPRTHLRPHRRTSRSGVTRAHLLHQISVLSPPNSPPLTAHPASARWWRFRKVHRALGFKFWAIISGGATLPPELEKFWNSLGFALIQGYGITETTALVTLNHPFHIGRGTIGKPLPGREVRISDNGEILVRGDDALDRNLARRPPPALATKEWLAPATSPRRTPPASSASSAARATCIVTAAGMNIHPADLEAAVARQPGVGACAVVPCAISQARSQWQW